METTTSADGTTLAFDRIGAGPVVILVAGATCTRGVTAPLAQALAADCTVINLDRRGRGDSDDRSGAPYAVAREIEDLAAVLSAVGPAAFYGHSSGAALVLRAAAAGLQLTRLVLHDAPYSLEPTEESRNYDVELRRLLVAGANGDAIALFLRQVGMPEPMVAGVRHAPHWPAMEAIAPTLAYDSAAMGDADGGSVPYDLLAAIDVPTLVLAGGTDPGFIADAAQALQRGIVGARFVHLAGAGHDAGPEVVVPSLAAFLTR